MNKVCARCQKTVYPTEELKCLDKAWHKGCFKCQECSMTLNMKTYKGYGKLPYCESHVPKVKPTTMAETPELKRIAENTKIQSNVKYHAAFEKSKGKFTQVADDPETLRIKANSRIISNVAYHGDLEKKAAMEKQRVISDNGEVVDLPTTDNYHLQLDSYASEMLPPTVAPPAVPSVQPQQSYTSQQNSHKMVSMQSNPNSNDQHYRQMNAIPKQPQHHQIQQPDRSDYLNSNNYNSSYGNHGPTPQYNMNHMTSPPNVQISSYAGNAPPSSIYDEYENQNVESTLQSQQRNNYMQSYGDVYYQERNVQQQRIGRIADYDPISDGPRNTPQPQRQGATVVYSSAPQQHNYHQQQHSHQPNNGRIGHQNSGNSGGSRRIGSVADMDPLNEVYGSLGGQMPSQQQHQQQMPSSKPSGNSGIPGRVYMAMYDYEATDSDEVSFREGDLITNVSSIDEGWMTGRVQRTGLTGMLPANYVELAKI